MYSIKNLCLIVWFSIKLWLYVRTLYDWLSHEMWLTGTISVPFPIGSTHAYWELNYSALVLSLILLSIERFFPLVTRAMMIPVSIESYFPCILFGAILSCVYVRVHVCFCKAFSVKLCHTIMMSTKALIYFYI